MKLFVLALLALSCVQLVIASGWGYQDDAAADSEDAFDGFGRRTFKTPDQLSRYERFLKKSKKRKDCAPEFYLRAALPAKRDSKKDFEGYGHLHEDEHHPELLIFEFSDKSAPRDPEYDEFIYFSRTIPKGDPQTDPLWRRGFLYKVDGQDLTYFKPLVTAEPYRRENKDPYSKKGYRGSDFKKNQEESEDRYTSLYLKAVVPPLYGLEERGVGRDGILKDLYNGVFSFEPARLSEELMKKDPFDYWYNKSAVVNHGSKGVATSGYRNGPLPKFYLKLVLSMKYPQMEFDTPGRLYREGDDVYLFETKMGPHIIYNKELEPIDPPGKIRRAYSYGNEALMRGLPNTYWNPASRFL